MTKQPSHIDRHKEALAMLRGSSEQERLLHRLHAVVLVHYGYSASEVARVYGDSPRSVAYWVTRFDKKGIDGLREDARVGRPSLLDGVQQKAVQTFIRKQQATPKPETAETVSQFIKKEFGINLSVNHCYRLLKRMKA